MINSGASTTTAVVSAAGVYTLTVTVDATGCSTSTDVTVTATMDLPNVSIVTPDQLTCDVTTVTLNASSTTANVTYQWSTTDGVIDSGANTATPIVSAIGTYTVVVTNTTTGCTSSQSVVVTSNTTPPAFELTTSGSISCVESTISLTATPSDINLVYAWTTNDGVIDSGMNQSTVVVSAAGNYTLTVTDPNTGCFNTKNIIVTAQTGAPNISILSPDLLGCNNQNVQLIGSSTTPGVTYAWTTTNGVIQSGTNESSATVAAAGMYVLTVTNPATGCFSTQTIQVSGSNVPPNLSVTSTGDISCLNPTATLTATSSESGLTYAWSTPDGAIQSGANTADVVVSTAGTYLVHISNAQTGCMNTASFVVNDISSIPNINIASPEVITCNLPNVTLVGSSDSTNVTFTWSTANGTIESGSNTANAVISSAGVYTLTITDITSGCSTSQNVEVFSTTDTPNINIDTPEQITCTNPTITLLGSSTTEGVSYLWTTSNGVIDSGADSPSVVVSTAGLYTLTITNVSTGCFVTQDVTVNASLSAPDLNVTTPETITCNNSMVGITASSTVNGVAYLWTTADGVINSGANLATVDVSAAGTYTVTVTNPTNGCTTSQNVIVQATNDLPEVSLSIPDVLSCTLLSTSITATSLNVGLTYQWTTTDGAIVSGANTATIEVNAAGIYTLTATDSGNGCVTIKNVEVTSIVNTPAITLSEPQTITCTNPTVDIIASTDVQGAVFNWSTIDGSILNGTNTNMITVDVGGTYTLLVIDPVSGCSNSQQIVIPESKEVPNLSVDNSDQITCAVTTVNLTASSTTANVVYSWTTNDGVIDTDSSASTITVSAGGAYTVTVTNPANGCTTSETVVVNEQTTIDYNVSVSNDITCFSPTATLTGSSSTSGLIYFWTAITGVIDSGANEATATVSRGGLYTLTVINPVTGCSESMSVNVDEDTTAPDLVITTPGQISCNAPTITLEAISQTSTLTYLWTTTNGVIDSGENTATPVVSAAGTYVVTIQNTENGCETIDSVEVIGTSALTVTVNIPGIITCLNTTVNLIATPSSANVNYTWTTANGAIVSGANSSTVEVSSAGVYTVTIVDPQTSCVTSENVTVTELTSLPTVSIEAPGLLTCNQTSLDLTGFSDIVGVSYAWTTIDGSIVSGVNDSIATIDAPGTYRLTVTNNTTGCTNFEEVVVNQNIEEPTVLIDTPEVLTCDVTEVSLTGSTSSTDVIYSWTTLDGSIVSGANSNIATVNAVGTYTLTITNTLSGCNNSVDVTIIEDLTAPEFTITTPEILTCLVTEVNLASIIDTTGRTFAWTSLDGSIVDGADSSVAVVNAAGTYTLTVTELSNGCTSSVDVTVIEDLTAPEFTITTPEILTCLVTEVNLASVIDTTGRIFAWTSLDGSIVDGADSSVAIVNAAGTYTLTVTELSNGCTSSVDVTVIEDLTAPEFTIVTPEILTCLVTEVNLASVIDTTGRTFAWTSLDGSILAGTDSSVAIVNSAGTYTLTVTELSNGCTSSVDVTVIEDLTAPEFTIATPEILTCLVTEVNLASVIDTTGRTFAWTSLDGSIVDGTDSSVAVVNSAGTYTLTVTELSNGCTSSVDVTVIEDLTAPEFTIATPETLTCLVTEVNLASVIDTTGRTFAWTSLDGSIVDGADSSVAIVNAAGTYTLTVTELSNGCTSSVDVTVIEDLTAPEFTIATPETLTCLVTEVNLASVIDTTGRTFAWTSLDGSIVAGTDSSVAVVNAAGTYTLTVTELSNGCTSSVDVTVIENLTAPVISIADPETLNCSNTEVSLIGSSSEVDVAYLWTTADGTISSGVNSSTAIVTSAGTYTLTVTNNTNGCFSTTSVTVIENGDGNISASLDPFANVLTVTPPFELTGGLPIGGTYTGVGVSNGTFDPSIAGVGTHTITYTVNNGSCEGTASQTITVETPQNGFAITSLTLVNADTDTDLFDIQEGDAINLATLPTANFNIRANSSGGEESVQLVLTGPVANTRNENIAPYALFGDSNGNYAGQVFSTGSYNISATPYSANFSSGNAGSTLSVNFSVIDNSTSYAVNLNANGAGTVSANPASGPYLEGTELTVTATPNANSFFINWTNELGDIVSVIESYNFTITGDVNLTANFEATQEYTLNVASNGDGTTIVSPDAPYFEGTEVTVTATPNLGFEFLNWTDTTGTVVSTTNPYIFNINSDISLTANFVAVPEYTLTLLSGGNGSASAAPLAPYFEGTDVTLTATPNTGYQFLNWTDENGTVVSSINPYTFAINSDVTIQANFELIPTFALTLNTDGNGTADASPQGPYTSGTSVTVTATPNANFEFVNWTDENGAVVSTANPYTFNISENQTLQANFNAVSSGFAVTRLALIDAVTNQELFDLQDGMQINLLSLANTSLSIRAYTNPTTVGSVTFALTGALTQNKTESVSPYALFGDSNGGTNFTMVRPLS